MIIPLAHHSKIRNLKNYFNLGENPLKNQKDKVSYIIGRQIGSDFGEQGIEIDFDHLIMGLKSAYEGHESLLSEEETANTMFAFQKLMAEKSPNLDSEASELNKAAGRDHLAKNASRDGVITTASGLQYRIIDSGKGKTPSATDTVETHYEGKLIDGTVFDSSYNRGEPTSFPVNRVIPGWTEALQLMREGDVWELTVPSELAYGARGAGGQIGPHSVLIFKIELISVR